MGRRWAGPAGLLVSAVLTLTACAAPARLSGPAGDFRASAAPSASAATASPTGSPTASPSAPVTTPRSGPSPATSPKALGPGEGMLTVLTLRGYAEYGGSDPDVNWVGPFEKSTGCRVNLRFPQAADQVGKLLAQTSYDVVSVPPEIAGGLVAEKKVVPLTTSLIPHYDDLPAWLRSQRSFVSGDLVYGVPFLWGSYVTLYDGDGVRPAKAEEIYADRGHVMFRDSPLSIADAALALKKRRPGLGISDPFELTPEQLDAAMQLLAKERDGERSYWRDPLDAVQGFAGGSVRLGQALPYHLDILRRAGRPVKALADGPTTGWVDSWMVSSRATAPNCAYKWLDWIISAKAQRQAAAWNGLAPANPEACTGAAKRICADYRVGDAAWLKKISFAVRPARDCATGGDKECTDYAEWSARWRELVP